MSAQYLDFVSVYALALVVASLVVFTQRGRGLLVRAMEQTGRGLGVGPWGLLRGFGYVPDVRDKSVAERISLAESYIISAEERTLHSARVVLWAMIAGCMACATAAIVIVGVLPPLVVSGAWTYETYVQAGMTVIYGTVAGGLIMGGGLIAGLWRGTVRLYRSEGCAAARGLVLSASGQGFSVDESAELASGRYPHLSRLAGHVLR